MALDLKRFVARFVEEAREHVRALEHGIPELENGADGEAVNALFRAAHTIKGSARMLKLMAVSESAHQLEDVLGHLREGKLGYTPALGNRMRRGVDFIARQVDQVADGLEPLPADQMPILLPDETGSTPSPAPPASAPVAPVEPPESRLKSSETVRISRDRLDQLIKLMGELVSSHARLRQRLADLRKLESRRTGCEADANRLETFTRQLHDDVFFQELLMEELHNRALVMRMLPLEVLFESVPRMMRELGQSLGKEIECTLTGMDIGLDRQLIDRLADPVVHLLRNAADHGIECADVRQKAGKPRYGTIKLTAAQDGNRVVIEVSDDGAGLALAAIREKAVRKGLLTPDQILTDDEVIDLIFVPGFSTQSFITDVSGRGVGMDVVKRCVVDELHGVIQVETEPGKGTRFQLKLPLSLAVMRVLLVSVDTTLFGFTAQSVAGILKIPSERLMSVTGREAVIIGNEFVPVVSLAELVCMKAPPPDQTLLLVILQVQSEKMAVRVDELLDERDMVIKPLPPHLHFLNGVAGMVLTGQNTLVSILHVPALFEQARAARTVTPVPDTPKRGETRRLQVLVADDSLNTRELERDVLEAQGYEVTLAADGLEALRMARLQRFDAVLTDVEMPNMDGFSLTRALRENQAYQDTPIIIITSRARDEDKRRGMEAGASAYILKGDFEQSGLTDVLGRLLG